MHVCYSLMLCCFEAFVAPATKFLHACSAANYSYLHFHSVRLAVAGGWCWFVVRKIRLAGAGLMWEKNTVGWLQQKRVFASCCIKPTSWFHILLCICLGLTTSDAQMHPTEHTPSCLLQRSTRNIFVWTKQPIKATCCFWTLTNWDYNFKKTLTN